MTVPLDIRNDIRAIDVEGVPRAEIAQGLGVSRNTVAKYADMEDMSPAAPVLAELNRRLASLSFPFSLALIGTPWRTITMYCTLQTIGWTIWAMPI